MRTAQARLIDSSLSRQTNFPLSIIPDRPLHRLTESMTGELSAVVTSMIPALLTDSWLASQAHRRQKRRGRKSNPIPRRWSLHSISRPRPGEVQCRRAELVDSAVAASSSRNARRFLIGVRNEGPSIVAVRVSNPDYRISVAAGADRGCLRDQPKARSV